MKREKGKAIYETKEPSETNGYGSITVYIGICAFADCFLYSDSRRNPGKAVLIYLEKKRIHILAGT